MAKKTLAWLMAAILMMALPAAVLGDAAKLTVSVSKNVRYAIAGKTEIALSANVQGGVGPYSVAMVIYRKGAQIDRENLRRSGPGGFAYSYMPLKYGDYEIKAVVTDARGSKAEDSVRVPVAVREYESERTWAASTRTELTGDWRDDLVAVARTQLGYEENKRNFVVDASGTHYYTRYGAWYGVEYAEWCAMFISFCLSYAEIPVYAFPRDAGCTSWKRELKPIYIDEENYYTPEKGDLVFINWQGENNPSHVGIVEEVGLDRIHTIEGNSDGQVRRKSYFFGDRVIVGYASMAQAMRNADRCICRSADKLHATDCPKYNGKNGRLVPTSEPDAPKAAHVPVCTCGAADGAHALGCEMYMPQVCDCDASFVPGIGTVHEDGCPVK